MKLTTNFLLHLPCDMITIKKKYKRNEIVKLPASAPCAPHYEDG